MKLLDDYEESDKQEGLTRPDILSAGFLPKQNVNHHCGRTEL